MPSSSASSFPSAISQSAARCSVICASSSIFLVSSTFSFVGCSTVPCARPVSPDSFLASPAPPYPLELPGLTGSPGGRAFRGSSAAAGSPRRPRRRSRRKGSRVGYLDKTTRAGGAKSIKLTGGSRSEGRGRREEQPQEEPAPPERGHRRSARRFHERDPAASRQRPARLLQRDAG